MIGFTSGSFDLLHLGHVCYLEACRKRCKLLIVMVGTDEQVRSAKGEDRPVLPQDVRVRMVSALKAVNLAFIDRWNRLDLAGLDEAFKEHKPDIYFCSEESRDLQYRRQLCERGGTKFVVMPRDEEYADLSTTAIIDKVRGNKYA